MGRHENSKSAIESGKEGLQRHGTTVLSRVVLHAAFVASVVGALTVMPACRKSRSDSGLNVVGAKLETGYPEVKLVQTDQVQVGLCTGVAVSDTTMLMAGHCVKSGSMQYGIRSPDTMEPASQVIFWNKVAGRELFTMHDAARDLAVVVLPPNALKPPYAKVAILGNAQGMVPTISRAPRAGEPVKLVGYGATTFAASASVQDGTLGTKNSGSNKLATFEGLDCDQEAVCDDQVIVLEADIVASSGNGELQLSAPIAASGDSGSPLFYRQDGQGEVVLGIGAAVGAFDKDGKLIPPGRSANGTRYLNIDGASKVRNLYTDLTSTASVTLMQLAVQKGAKIPGMTALNGGLSALDAAWMIPSREGDHGSGGYLGIFFPFGTLSGLFGGSQAATTSSPSISGGGRSCFFVFCFGSSSGSSSVTVEAQADDDSSTTAASPTPVSTGTATEATAGGADKPVAAVAAVTPQGLGAATEAFSGASRPFWQTVRTAAGSADSKLTPQQQADLKQMADSCEGQIVPRRGLCDPQSAAAIIRNANPSSATVANLGTQERALSQATVQANTVVPAEAAGSTSFDKGVAQRIFAGRTATPQPTAATPSASAPSATPQPATAASGASASASAQVVAPAARPGAVPTTSVTAKASSTAPKSPAAPAVNNAVATACSAGVCKTAVAKPTPAATSVPPRPAPPPAPRPAPAPAPKPAGN